MCFTIKATRRIKVLEDALNATIWCSIFTTSLATNTLETTSALETDVIVIAHCRKIMR